MDGPVVGTVRIADRADTRFYGEHDDDQAAFVNSAGDLDQDGLMDVAVARTAEDGDTTGAVYVYYGALPGGAHPMGELADATILGDGPNNWPIALAGAGDVDGDCMPDLAVGARFGDAVYLLRGGTL
ncbi:MAG: FG-GAP repeat protein [Gemmatimonadaceae bacterium]|nr:FG-GAP repeat protein [Gemmatimonadaceae bacterium]